MNSPSTPNNLKACLIPVCKNEKFALVHKFPADKERFAEWLSAIQPDKPIDKLRDLGPEAIRKRFFICSRHFAPNQYKNAESRSLNLTALPRLNISNLDELSESKAGQMGNSIKTNEDNIIIEQVAPRILNVDASVKLSPNNIDVITLKPQVSRILNAGASKTALKPRQSFEKPRVGSLLVKKMSVEVNESSTVQHENPPEDFEEIEVIEESPPAKRRKQFTSQAKEALDDIKASVPQKAEVVPYKPAKTNAKQEESVSTEAQPATQQNKLLALIEVTPEQYEKLNSSLSTAERSEQITSLLGFIGKSEPDLAAADNEIDVELPDGSQLKLDQLWLRDHCRCPSCYDDVNHQRKISVLDIPDDIETKSFKVVDEQLQVVWSDGHPSSYKLSFLKEHFTCDDSVKKPEVCLWDKEVLELPFQQNCRVNMRDYMSDPLISKKVLENLHVYGVALIDGVQPNQQNTEFVIRQLFPVHKTLFGEMWTFSDAKTHSDTAYTNIYLGPHTDNTYFNDAAGLQILHCIQHSGNGGENFLIDGFQVAKSLKTNQPEVFDRLTKTIVTAEYIEDGRHHKHSAPIINACPLSGEVMQIRFNLYDRAPFKIHPGLNIRQFYSDLRMLAQAFEEPNNQFTFKLEPGSVLIFDNWRVLHGRRAYTGKRTMTGCYVSRTEFQSSLRVVGLIE